MTSDDTVLTVSLDRSRGRLSTPRQSTADLGASKSKKPQDQPSAILLAVKPHWAEMLVEGIKTVEFRRRGPGAEAIGKPVLIYASSPVRSIIGHGITFGYRRAALSELWSDYAAQGGVRECDFNAYFTGVQVGDALMVRCRRLSSPVDLDSLRVRFNWTPPMSWSWLRADSPLLRLLPVSCQ